MRVVILAGGFGTRLSEETTLKPKPMVEIGGKPILWHIMKIYSAYGLNDFIICLGYKGYVIKEYFANYFLHVSDVTFDIKNNSMHILQNSAEPWTVTLVDTGLSAGTGGRLKLIRDYVGDEDFCFTYGDGLSNVNVAKLIEHHNSHDKLATVTAIQPPQRYGVLVMEEDRIISFDEKPEDTGAWINGGYFVLSPKVIDYIESETTMWEQNPMRGLVRDNQLSPFFHNDFWYPMDTLRDRNRLEDLWKSGKAPWRIWK